jgi:hypothetical protein
MAPNMGLLVDTPKYGVNPTCGAMHIPLLFGLASNKKGRNPMAQRKQSATVDLKVRMKEPLRAALERSARQRGRSLNAEIVQRLERSLQDEEILAKISNQLAGIEKAMMEKQEEQFEKLFKQWKEDEAADELADIQRNDPDYIEGR